MRYTINTEYIDVIEITSDQIIVKTKAKMFKTTAELISGSLSFAQKMRRGFLNATLKKEATNNTIIIDGLDKLNLLNCEPLVPSEIYSEMAVEVSQKLLSKLDEEEAKLMQADKKIETDEKKRSEAYVPSSKKAETDEKRSAADVSSSHLTLSPGSYFCKKPTVVDQSQQAGTSKIQVSSQTPNV